MSIYRLCIYLNVISLITTEKISCIYLLLYIVQTAVIPVGNDGLAHLLELRKVIDHLAAEERTAVLQSRLVDNHRSSFRLDPLHHAQDAALAEVIGFALHGQAEYTYYTCFFFIFTVVTFIIIVIISCHRKYLISNKIFSRPIRFYNC